MTKSQNIVRGAFFIVTAEVSFALSAALIKLVSDSLPNQSIVFFRNLFGLLILTPLLLNAGENILKTNRLHFHLFRSGIGMGAMYCFFYRKTIKRPESVKFSFCVCLGLGVSAIFFGG